MAETLYQRLGGAERIAAIVGDANEGREVNEVVGIVYSLKSQVLRR